MVVIFNHQVTCLLIFPLTPIVLPLSLPPSLSLSSSSSYHFHYSHIMVLVYSNYLGKIKFSGILHLSFSRP